MQDLIHVDPTTPLSKIAKITGGEESKSMEGALELLFIKFIPSPQSQSYGKDAVSLLACLEEADIRYSIGRKVEL